MDIKIIALDLDGTLLTTDKRLTEENRRALERAAEKGIEIVPSTGRFYKGMPEVIKDLDFIHYAITINGAEVLDLRKNKVIYGSDIPLDTALYLNDRFDALGVAHDVYVQSIGYMDRRFLDHIEDYLPDPIYCSTLRGMRVPLDDVRAFMIETGKNIQKVQIFSKSVDVLLQTGEYIRQNFPELIATSSLKNNLEVNNAKANKGDALRALTDYLGLRSENTMAFGDGGNDLPMLRAAGVSVAMGNSLQTLKDEADYTTLTHDQSGVAYMINKLLDGEL
ncbi:MAG: HAD family phosphatase [Firmicutes bacterium]|nr:HAD family phosphatase [Bacillota bacterium]